MVGAGYVGLVTGACLAHIGYHVTLVDVSEERIAGLERGELPIYEPGLETMMARNSGRIKFSTKVSPVARDVDVLFIAVSTPPGEDGSANLSNVSDVARSIGRTLSEAERKRPLVIVNKSTVPVGSGNYVSMLVREGGGDLESGPGTDSSSKFVVVSNPEFLREGSAVHDSLFPDRIVLGADSREALDIMRTLYQPIIEQSFPIESLSTGSEPGLKGPSNDSVTNPKLRPTVAVPFLTTDLASSEMIKYAANAFLATKVSFINEIANICEMVGADVGSVAAGIGLDERIGSRS